MTLNLQQQGKSGNKTAPLTDEQLAALTRFRKLHGRIWKSVLANAWMTGIGRGYCPSLHSLRNTHGPSWLADFRNPRVSA